MTSPGDSSTERGFGQEQGVSKLTWGRDTFIWSINSDNTTRS